MSRGLEEIKRDASTLTPDEQHELAIWLQDSFAAENGDSQEAIDEAWVLECERRSTAMDSSGAKPLNWDDTLKRLRNRYPD